MSQLIEKAAGTHNISFCKTLSESDKEQCFIQTARRQSNSFNLSLCEALRESAKIECFTAAVNASNNVGLCLKLSIPENIKECHSRFGITMKKVSLNESFLFSSKNLYNTPIGGYAFGSADGTAMNNDSPLNGAKPNEPVYTYYAPSADERIVVEDAKDKIYNSRSMDDVVKYKNVSFCETLPQADKEHCIIRFAQKTNNFDSSLCETLTDHAKTECYIASAKTLNNSDICLKINDVDDVKECYWYFVESVSCSEEATCSYDGTKECLGCKLENANLSKKELIEPLVEPKDCAQLRSPLDNVCYANAAQNNANIAIYRGEPKWCFDNVRCMILVALKNNISLEKCDSLGAGYINCYWSVAYANSNIPMCAKLPAEYRYKCEESIVTDTYGLKLIRNLSICFSASAERTVGGGATYRSHCATRAVQNNNYGDFFYSNCDTLYQLGSDLSRACSYDLAVQTKNISLCSRTDRKEECETIVNHLNSA